MATIKDIAKALDIAVSTVSKGLNGASDISEELRQQVIDKAVELGYTTKKMQKQEKKKICIFVENMDYESSDQFGYDIVTGFKKAAVRKHWEVSLVPANLTLQAEERYDSYMLRNGFHGGFFLGFTLHEDWIEQLSDTHVPTVLLDNFIPENPHVGYVGTDSFEGIRAAVNYLVEKGHTKIAFLNGSKNSMVTRERQEAFEQAMRNNGLKPEEKLMEYGYYVPDCARYHVPGFLENGATAIMCASDSIGIGVVIDLENRGVKVPEEVSVIGFDDIPAGEKVNPPLTTVRQDRSDLGKSAAILLDGLMNNVAISKLLLRARLVERQSAGKVKKE